MTGHTAQTMRHSNDSITESMNFRRTYSYQYQPGSVSREAVYTHSLTFVQEFILVRTVSS